MKLNLPVILLKGTILMPENEIKLEFDDEISKSIIDISELFHSNKILIVSRLSIDENYNIEDLPKIGTIAKITRKLELPNGKVRVVLKGITRAGIIEYLNPSKDTLESIISIISKEQISEDIKSGMVRKLYSEIDSYVKKVPYMSNSLLSLISNIDDLSKMTDIIVNHIPIEKDRVFEYLLETNTLKRVEMILEDIYKEEQLFNIEKNLDTKVQKNLDKDQKEFLLREKIKLIKEELGDSSLKEDEIELLKSSVKELDTSSEIKLKILHEIKRYEDMSTMSPELSIVRNYIDWMLNLPWNKKTKDATNLKTVKEKLNTTHYGLEEVKMRIIEFLAVKKQSKNVNTPIICLVGPPGVGKTTLASSIAKSINRKFVKISVGGVSDEAEIKGHIRTYIGATPGKIIDGLKRAKSSNPVFLIDEIDKMTKNYKGDPESALLEVLDSNQNKYFKDNYIEEETDLSNVLFILTANDISNISEPLKDRLEIINISGYTELEKLDIANNYLIPKICKEHAIDEISISDDFVLNIIKFYTKEAGLRELTRMLTKIVRKIVTNKVINNDYNLNIDNIEKYLGNKIYTHTLIENAIGKVNGLAYTNYGGDILSIESVSFEGNSNLILTGSLGDVIKESANIALSYIKSNYKLFNIDYKQFKKDIHINIPDISIKKEGPSAGVALATSLISMLTNLSISNKIAFTGEMTLRGEILKVGGIKEKAIGAYINNVDTIFIPCENKDDLDSLPKEIINKINFVLVKNYSDVYKYLKENSNGK